MSGEAVAPTLKEQRHAQGLTQRELAARLGVSTSQVAAWETGAEPVPEAHRNHIAAHLAVTEVSWDIPHTRRALTVVPRRVRFGVQGTTGEKDDRQTWIVGMPMVSFERAHRLVARLNAWCRLHRVALGECLASWRERDGLRCPDDPTFACDYTGTQYVVVPLIVDVPRPK